MRLIKTLIIHLIAANAKLLVALFWGNSFWRLKASCKANFSKLKYQIYLAYQERYGAWIGLDSEIKSAPHCPHGLYGIFISANAKIGDNCVIFQHVTIGSNTLKGSNKLGSPTIGDNCYIGAGAKIIGKINVGDNCRIGANCIVVKDVPSNCTCILRGTEIIENQTIVDNTFYPIDSIKHLEENIKDE